MADCFVRSGGDRDHRKVVHTTSNRDILLVSIADRRKWKSRPLAADAFCEEIRIARKDNAALFRGAIQHIGIEKSRVPSSCAERLRAPVTSPRSERRKSSVGVSNARRGSVRSHEAAERKLHSRRSGNPAASTGQSYQIVITSARAHLVTAAKSVLLSGP